MMNVTRSKLNIVEVFSKKNLLFRASCHSNSKDADKFNEIDEQYFGTVKDVNEEAIAGKIEPIEDLKSLDLLGSEKEDSNEFDKFYFTGEVKPSDQLADKHSEESQETKEKKDESKDLNFFDQDFFGNLKDD